MSYAVPADFEVDDAEIAAIIDELERCAGNDDGDNKGEYCEADCDDFTKCVCIWCGRDMAYLCGIEIPP